MLCLVFPRGCACGLCVLRALPSPSIGSASSVISRARRPALTVVHDFTAQFPPVPYCEQPRNSPRRQLDWSQGLCWPCTPNPHKTRGALGYEVLGFPLIASPHPKTRGGVFRSLTLWVSPSGRSPATSAFGVSRAWGFVRACPCMGQSAVGFVGRLLPRPLVRPASARSSAP